MELKEYLNEIGIPVTVFARQIGVSESCMHWILKRKMDLRTSVALKIENKTNGLVKARNLIPVEKEAALFSSETEEK